MDIGVIQLESPAAVGDSGGPVLDSGNRLVGMVIGGAGADIVWIIPVSRIVFDPQGKNWRRKEDETEALQGLAALGPRAI